LSRVCTAVVTGNHPKSVKNMFLADLPGFKNPFLIPKKSFYLAYPSHQKAELIIAEGNSTIIFFCFIVIIFRSE